MAPHSGPKNGPRPNELTVGSLGLGPNSGPDYGTGNWNRETGPQNENHSGDARTAQ